MTIAFIELVVRGTVEPFRIVVPLPNGPALSFGAEDCLSTVRKKNYLTGCLGVVSSTGTFKSELPMVSPDLIFD